MVDIRDVNGKGQDEGVYILLVRLDKTHKIKPGRLPEADYERGAYLYVGRAKTGLRARVKRHLRKEKKLFWHIDYLLQRGKITDIWIRRDHTSECATAGDIRNSRPVTPKLIQGFGSSDCRCAGHLFYFPPGIRSLDLLRDKMAFKKVGIDGNSL
jgi:Uri superfamily endonuclease